MTKLEIENKKEYLIAEAYFEIAICLMQDLETFCSQDTFLEKIYSQNKLHDIYQKSFHYFNKGCERNLKPHSKEHELFELTKNYVEQYINRCSFYFIQNFDSYGEDIKNTACLNDLNNGLEYICNSIKLMQENSIDHVTNCIAKLHYKSNVASFHLVSDYFDSSTQERHRELMHEAFFNMTKSITIAEQAIQDTHILNKAKVDYQFLNLHQFNTLKPVDEYLNHSLMVIRGWSDLSKVSHALLDNLHGNKKLEDWYENAHMLEHSCLLRSIFNKHEFVLELFDEPYVNESLICGNQNVNIPLKIN